MRDILFRGKAIDVRCNERWIGKGEWVYGFYHYTNWYDRLTKELVETHYWILPVDSQDGCQVDPYTVGQYTGLRDKNGIKIFEGDIVNCKTTAYSFEGGVIIWSAEEARWAMLKGRHRYPVSDLFMYEVIGNIHDNPEMLEE